MLPLNKIREDLKEIRYYYARKEIFDSAIGGIGLNKVFDTVKKYNTAVQNAPPRLYDLYICLYVKNYTQESLSIELGYTPEYIQMQHKKLLLFLQSYFKNEADRK